ncbi:MAG: tRNA (guanosine(37)-N1)-methyltransferase TrmD [bacterium]|nr:tRNA (guanosine(37)-N1)-methyltransferase TrmD [bacterium]
MRVDVITIFPQVLGPYLDESLLRRARERGLLDVAVHNLRDFVDDKHKTVDDAPYGGGPGMVMKAEPIVKAVDAIASEIGDRESGRKTKVILFSPGGVQFDARMARRFAKLQHIILICGRYEGVDERVKKILRAQEISIGPYVLTGGELPAMVFADAVARHIPGVLGKHESLEERRYGVGVPVYTRPEIFTWGGRGYRVPKVLLSGDHRKIEGWRNAHSKPQAPSSE